MLVRSQSKEHLVDAILIGITKRNNKILVYAQYAANNETRNNLVEIGEYQTKEMAIKEIDDIMQFFSENPSGIYQMK